MYVCMCTCVSTITSVTEILRKLLAADQLNKAMHVKLVSYCLLTVVNRVSHNLSVPCGVFWPQGALQSNVLKRSSLYFLNHMVCIPWSSSICTREWWNKCLFLQLQKAETICGSKALQRQQGANKGGKEKDESLCSKPARSNLKFLSKVGKLCKNKCNNKIKYKADNWLYLLNSAAKIAITKHHYYNIKKSSKI